MTRYLRFALLALTLFGATGCQDDECAPPCTKNGDCTSGMDCMPLDPLNWDGEHVCLPRDCGRCVLLEQRYCDIGAPSEECAFRGCR